MSPRLNRQTKIAAFAGKLTHSLWVVAAVRHEIGSFGL